MNLTQVRKRIDRFASLSPGHRTLALQAAIPVALTPDLLYRLWTNFQRDATPAQALLEIPWIAVADLLLSNLCEETGYEQYELTSEIRAELLAQLAVDPRLGLTRIWELADFIQQYVRRQLEVQVNNPQLDLARVQQINALAYTDPDGALNELLGAYQRIGAQGGAELLRLASLVEKIAAPAQASAAGQNPATVAGFEQLKTFSGGLSLWVSGDAGAARERLEQAFGPNFVVQIGSVRLDVPPQLVSYVPPPPLPLPTHLVISLLSPTHSLLQTFDTNLQPVDQLPSEVQWPAWLYRAKSLTPARVTEIPGGAASVGAALFQSLLPGESGARFAECYGHARRSGMPLEVELQLESQLEANQQGSERSKLPSIFITAPWELLNFSIPSDQDENPSIWLASDPNIHFTRRPPNLPPLSLRQPARKIPLILVIASPFPEPGIGRKFHPLVQELRNWAGKHTQEFQLVVIDDTSNIFKYLPDAPQILHFICPFRLENEQPALGIRDSYRGVQWLGARGMLELLSQSRPAQTPNPLEQDVIPPLWVISNPAMGSSPAEASPSDSSAGQQLAFELSKILPAAILALDDGDVFTQPASLGFLEEFYSAVLTGAPLGSALQSARGSSYTQKNSFPALFTTTPELPLLTTQTSTAPPPEKVTQKDAVQDLFDQIQQLQSTIPGRRPIAPQILTKWTETSLTWADPNAALYPIDPAQFDSASRDPQQRYAFYVAVFTLTIVSGQDTQIGKINIQLEFKSPQLDFEPVVTSLFPTAEWESSISLGASLEFGVTRSLNFGIQPDPGWKAKTTPISAGSEPLISFGTIPPYGVSPVKIISNAGGSQTATWQFDHLNLRKEASITLGAVIRVPLNARQMQATVQVRAEPNYSWLAASLKDVFGSLSESAQNLLAGNQPGLQFALAETWDLKLPMGSQLDPEPLEDLDSLLPGESPIDALVRRLKTAAISGPPAAQAALATVQKFQTGLHIEVENPVPGEYGFLNLSPVVLAQAGLTLPESLAKEFSAGNSLFSLVFYVHIQSHSPTSVNWLLVELELDGGIRNRLSVYSTYPPTSQSQPQEPNGGDWQRAGIDPALPYRLLLVNSSSQDKLSLMTVFADNVGAGPMIDLTSYRLSHDNANLIRTEGVSSSKAVWEIQQPAAPAESLFTLAVLFTAPASLQALDLRVNVTVRPPDSFPDEPDQAVHIQRLSAGLDQPLSRKETFPWHVVPPNPIAPRATLPDDLTIYTTADGLALRTQPWESAIVLDRLPLGSSLRVLEQLKSALAKLQSAEGWLLAQTVPEAGARSRPAMTGFLEARQITIQSPTAGRKGSEASSKPPELEELLGYITSEGTALRTSPATTGSLISRLPTGTTLLLLDTPQDARANIGKGGKFLHVRVQSATLPTTEGYVTAEFISLTPPAAQATPNQTAAPKDNPLFAHVSAADATLQASHSASSAIVQRLPRGTVLELLDAPEVAPGRVGAQGQWLHVRVQATAPNQKTSREGYIAGIYVSLTPPSNEGVQTKPPPRAEEERPRPVPVRSRVLLVIFNPRLPSQAKVAQTLIQSRGYANPANLAKLLVDTLRETSHGYARFEIAETVTREELPLFEGGFRYAVPDYLQVLDGKAPPHQPGIADYAALINDLRVVDRLNQRELDEIWLMAPPNGGLYESRMLGPKAYAVNSPGLPSVPGLKRAVVVMGFNYERGLGEMLESFGHRAEAILQHIYAETHGQENLWYRFTQVKKTISGYEKPEVGTMHLAPNSRADYDWSNPEVVSSGCDAWLDFPDLKAPLRPVNCDEWGSDMVGHHRWWFEHLPCAAGQTGKVSNNWWEYVLDPVQEHQSPVEGKQTYE